MTNDRKFTFGKYRGRLISDVIKFDAQYVNWAAQCVEWFDLTDQEIRELHEQFEKDAARIGIYRHSGAWFPQVNHEYIADRIQSVERLPAFGGGTYEKVTYVSGRIEERNHQYYTGDE